MTLLTVPLNDALSGRINDMVNLGVASNKADLARKAIEHYIEELAVREVLQAEQEYKEGKVLKGDIDELSAKL